MFLPLAMMLLANETLQNVGDKSIILFVGFFKIEKKNDKTATVHSFYNTPYFNKVLDVTSGL